MAKVTTVEGDRAVEREVFIKGFMSKIEVQQEEIKDMSPKVKYHDEVLDTKNGLTTRTIANDHYSN